MEIRIMPCWAVFLLAGLSANATPGQSPANHLTGGSRTTPALSPVIPMDVLRHPVTPKVRKILLSAMAKIDAGEHEPAIDQLKETLRKYPESAPYVQNLLGAEYVKTDQLPEAISSFEQAVSLLPHDPMTHYNFGLALICAGDYDRAANEVRRALELDPQNQQMQARLREILAHGHSRH